MPYLIIGERMTAMKVRNFGPIKEADVPFGDLTILVGPQASGKSLFLELFKLVRDRDSVADLLRKYNYILPEADAGPALDVYFGEGLRSLFREETLVELDGVLFDADALFRGGGVEDGAGESVFYVPAQRILSMSDGRPKNFMEFDSSVPFVLRKFSESLRLYLQGGLGNPDVLFPVRGRLAEAVSSSIDATVFHGASVVMDQSGGQRKLKLDVGGTRLPFMAWSAGQKEFMPLLLALFFLSGPQTSVIDKRNYKCVVIEEPEMGLHPRAVETVLLEIAELVRGGYKVVVSTHSATVLEFAWVVQTLGGLNASDFKAAMCELFGIEPGGAAAELFGGIYGKDVRTHYFSPGADGVTARDISSLDVGALDRLEADWGCISSFSEKASDVVGKYYRERGVL